MKYEELPAISRDELEMALVRAKPPGAARALLRMALHEPDAAWAERKCLGELNDDRDDVRAAAVVGLGHLARIHHTLLDPRVLEELRKLQQDPRLGGVAEDALEDILTFTSSQARTS